MLRLDRTSMGSSKTQMAGPPFLEERLAVKHRSTATTVAMRTELLQRQEATTPDSELIRTPVRAPREGGTNRSSQDLSQIGVATVRSFPRVDIRLGSTSISMSTGQ